MCEPTARASEPCFFEHAHKSDPPRGRAVTPVRGLAPPRAPCLSSVLGAARRALPFARGTGAACQQRALTHPDTWSCPTLGLIESNTTLREGRGNPIRVSKICNPRRGDPSAHPSLLPRPPLIEAMKAGRLLFRHSASGFTQHVVKIRPN